MLILAYYKIICRKVTNESQVKNKILSQLYQRMNENNLNANIQELSSTIKLQIDSSTNGFKHGYYYTVIFVLLFTLLFYFYWIVCLVVSIFALRYLTSKSFEINFV